MVEVDVNVIQKYVEKLNSYSNELEQIHLNLFNQLKNSCMNWQDTHTLLFEDAVYNDKIETNDILKNIKSKSNIYSFICEKYIVLGKQIKCNLNSKNAILNKINECYYMTTDILDQFSYIDRSFYYDEIYSINAQRSKFEKVKSELNDLYYDIKNIYSKIESIEYEIAASIKRLQDLNIKKFEFDEEMLNV